MHRLNAVYSQGFNRRHERVGHLLQGRFKAILVEKERHLLELVRYVVLNPVRAGLVPTRGGVALEQLPGDGRPVSRRPAWLETEWTIAQFGGGAAAREAYREFVTAGAAVVDRPWRRIAGQLFLGSDEFRRRMRGMLAAQAGQQGSASRAAPGDPTGPFGRRARIGQGPGHGSLASH